MDETDEQTVTLLNERSQDRNVVGETHSVILGGVTVVAPWLGLGVGTRGKRNLLGEEEVGEEALQAEVAA